MSQTKQTVQFDGFTYELMLPSIIDTELAAGREWEPDTTKQIKQLVKLGMVVIDIGANIGYFTLLMSRLVGGGGRVVAFEPAPRFIRRLDQHLHINNIYNVRIVPFALYNENCERTIVVNAAPTYPSANLVSNETVIQNREFSKCRCLKLDEWWTWDSLDFIKLDVDGTELEILQGAAAILDKFQPMMIIELPVGKAGPVGMFLSDHNYRLYNEKTNKELTLAEITAATVVSTINVVAMPKEKTNG